MSFFDNTKLVGNIFTLYVGSKNGEPWERGTDEVIYALRGFWLNFNCTVSEATGFYNNKKVPTMAIKVIGPDGAQACAKFLGKYFEQETVGIEFNGNFYLIDTAFERSKHVN